MTYLVKDFSSGARAVRVQCLACGKMVQLSDAVIDKDGPAFMAYYHDAEPCRPEGPVRVTHHFDGRVEKA
jgi:hypothetical protein